MSRFNEAFTLLEVVLAIVIMGAAMLAIMQGIAQCLNSVESIRNHGTARELFSNKLAELELREELEEGYEDGDFEETHPGFAWSTEVSPTDYPDLYQVRIRIEWTEQGQVVSHSVETYKHLPSDQPRRLGETTRRPGEPQTPR